MGNPNPKNQVGPGNQLATKHGAEGALVRLSQGKPFLGIALETQRQVEADFGIDLNGLSGPERMLVEDAIGLKTLARLFHAAALGAAEKGDLEAWERFSQRQGWITGKSFNVTKEVGALLAEKADAVILDALREAENGDD